MGRRAKKGAQLDAAALVNISTLSELCRRQPELRFLLQEWHPSRNRNLPPYGITLTPEAVPPTDRRLVWWQCKRGHNWNDSVSARIQGILNVGGDECPFCKPERIERKDILWDYCMGEIPDGEYDAKHLLEEWDAERNHPLTPRDVKTVEYRKVWWRCAKGHCWQALISNRVKGGAGCPYCGHRRVLAGFNDLQTLYPQLAAEWDTEKNRADPQTPDAPDQVTAFSNRKAWWRCPAHHAYQKIIANRTQYGQGCPVCRGLRNEKGSMLLPGVNDLATTHPDVAAQWNEVRNGALTTAEVKAGSRRLVWWRCKAGHEWQTPVSRRTGGRKTGCPYCHGGGSGPRADADAKKSL